MLLQNILSSTVVNFRKVTHSQQHKNGAKCCLRYYNRQHYRKAKNGH